MLKFNVFLLFLLIISVTTGCIKNEVQQSQNTGCDANFIVDKVEGTFSISKEKALPEQFTLTLTAKLRSNAKIETVLPSTEWAIGYSENAVNKPVEKIEIQEPLDHRENNVIRRSTDGNGVLRWTENFEYAYAKQSKWIVINRYIKGLSNAYTGVCKIPLAINPWLQKPEHADIQIADYRKEYHLENDILEGNVEENPNTNGIDFLLQKKKEEERHGVDIIVDELTLHKDGTEIKAGKTILKGNTIEAQLKYRIKDIHGSIQPSPIRAGDFELQTDLLIMIPKPDGKKQYLKMNENSSGTSINFENDQFISERFDWTIPFVNFNTLPFALYLKITPTETTGNRINSFEGIYHIGNRYTEDIIPGNKLAKLKLNSILAEKYKARIRNSKNNSSDDVTPVARVSNTYQNPDECLTNIPLGRTSNLVASCISTQQTSAYLDGFTTATWSVERINLNFSQVEQENWLSRKIKTNVETTINDSINTAASHSDIQIKITDLSTGKITKIEDRKTDSAGHITFTISTEHNWYKRQRYFLKLIHFSTKTGALNIKKIIAINPWDYGFTHGFEVDHYDSIRTTCLDSNTDNPTLLDLFDDTDSLSQYTNHQQRKTINNLFCVNTTKDMNQDNSQNKNLDNAIIKRFNNFKSTVKNKLKNWKDQLFQKFTSSRNTKPAEVNIHLFRSITKWPTSLIDNSLNREIYYNTRFKLSPFVVRFDSIRRGQQNKGPIRDGIYIFQMAILKNEQGRQHGNKAMVIHRANFSLQNRGSTAGTILPFINCDIKDPNCLEDDDFIMPPTDIPVVIRNGIMKVDVNILIKRQYLLFANSKNMLIFRILPADPESIVCTNPEIEDCTKFNYSEESSYLNHIKWNEETIKNIQPATTESYDIKFYTYKTPFIPSLWNNWNITHELDTSFDDLAEQYNRIKQQEINTGSHETFKHFRDNTELEPGDELIQNSQDPSYTPPRIHADTREFIQPQIDILQEIRFENMFTIDENKNTTTTAKAQITNAINKKKIDLENYLNNTVNNDDNLSEEQKIKILEAVDERIKDLETLRNRPSLTVEPQVKQIPQIPPVSENNTVELDVPDSQSTSSDTPQESEPDTTATESSADTNNGLFVNAPCVDKSNIVNQSESTQITEEKVITEEDHSCLAENKPEETNKNKPKDLSKRHLEHFISTNTLCAINIDSPSITKLDNSCGKFTNTATAQQSFIDDLNEQIEIINKKITEIKNYQQTHNRSSSIDFWVNPQLKTADQEEKQESFDQIQNAYKNNHLSSDVFKNKLKNMPQLPKLGKEDLVKIIQSEDINISDKKTGAFLHALCGFWFGKFLSDKYITSDLLLNGLRNTVKETFYYRLRALTDNDEDNDEIIKTLNDLKKSYEEALGELKTEGDIDNLHKWVENSEDYGFDSDFHNKLHNKLNTLLQESPLKNEKPSWSSRNNTSENGSDENKKFHPDHYLNEALMAIASRSQPIILRNQDFHPFRKCINNPSHFFGFEKKVIVGKIGDDQGLSYGHKTERGKQTTLTINEEFFISSQRDKGGSQELQTKIGGDLALLALPILGIATLGASLVAGGLIPFFHRLFLKKTATSPRLQNAFNTSFPAVVTILGFSGLVGGTHYNYRSYEGTGKRKALSTRVSEGVDLISEHTPITIPLEKYHDCMVIRPRFSAFEHPRDNGKYNIWNKNNKILVPIYEKTGILLCAENKTSTEIYEDYYYIYPNYPINGITMDPSSHRNKPFAISLRGKRAHKQFIQNLNCPKPDEDTKKLNCRNTNGNYNYLLNQNIEFIDDLKENFNRTKMFHLTGDIPGVYSRYTEENIEEDKTGGINKLLPWMNWWADRQFFDIDLVNLIRDEPESQ